MSLPDIDLYYWDGTGYTSFNAPIQTMTISRGRSRQLNRYESGSMTITFFNADRKLDPLNTASAYYGLVVPRIEFLVEADSIPIFTGVVTDWDLEYDISGQDTAIAFCSDAMTILSNFVFTAETTFDKGTIKKRFEDVLSHFGYTGATDLNVGNSNLAPEIVEPNVQCVDYLFRAATSDGGNFFISADGKVTFKGRYGDPSFTAELAFADDGTGIGYSSLKNQYGDELLYNEVYTASPVGSSFLQNTTSVSTFGLSVLSYDNLLNEFEYDLDALSGYFLKLYGDPIVRFTGLQIELAGLSTADQADVLNLDLADFVTVKRSFDVGSPSSVTQNLIVTGVQHSIRPGSHVVEFTFEPISFEDYLLLDSSTNGILNTDVLGI